MPVHHTNPKCDICGERHAADHPIECRDGLAAEVVLKREELADAEADLAQEREKNAKLREALTTLPLTAYSEAQDKGESAHSAMDTLLEAIRAHVQAALAQPAQDAPAGAQGD